LYCFTCIEPNPNTKSCLKTKEGSAAAALESDKPCLKPSCRRQHLFGLPAAGRMLGSVRGGRKQQLPSDHCKHSLIVDMVLYKLQTAPIHTPRMCCQVQVALPQDIAMRTRAQCKQRPHSMLSRFRKGRIRIIVGYSAHTLVPLFARRPETRACAFASFSAVLELSVKTHYASHQHRCRPPEEHHSHSSASNSMKFDVPSFVNSMLRCCRVLA
jgi:hypothetical protein